MLIRTHTATAPWRMVRAINRRLGRLNYAGRKVKLVRSDFDIAFEFTPDCLEAGRLAADLPYQGLSS